MTLRQQLNQLDVTECMMGNRKTVRQNFDIAANRLAEILREVFKEYQQLRYEELNRETVINMCNGNFDMTSEVV